MSSNLRAYTDTLRSFTDENSDVCDVLDRADAALREAIAELEGKQVAGVKTIPAQARQQCIAAALAQFANCIVSLRNAPLSAATLLHEANAAAERERRPRVARVGDKVKD